MPTVKRKSKLSRKISLLHKEGYPNKQAVAIAHSMKRRRKLKEGGLTQGQEGTMKKHSEHQTKKHLSVMRKEMKRGKTFGESHKVAIKKVGK